MAETAEEFEALRRFIEREEAEDRFSGTVVIEHGSETIFTGAYGHAHLGLGVRNQLDTRFNLASITKMFTTVATLQLIEQGKLSLDATVNDFVPEVGIGMGDGLPVTVYCVINPAWRATGTRSASSGAPCCGLPLTIWLSSKASHPASSPARPSPMATAVTSCSAA